MLEEVKPRQSKQGEGESKECTTEGIVEFMVMTVLTGTCSGCGIKWGDKSRSIGTY